MNKDIPFVLRIPKDKHRSIKHRCRKAGVSMNVLINYLIANPKDPLGVAFDNINAAVERAANTDGE